MEDCQGGVGIVGLTAAASSSAFQVVVSRVLSSLDCANRLYVQSSLRSTVRRTSILYIISIQCA